MEVEITEKAEEKVVEEIEKKAKKKTIQNDVYTVETPVKNYNGTVAGIQFAYGKAEVRNGWILNWFKENGYIIKKK